MGALLELVSSSAAVLVVVVVSSSSLGGGPQEEVLDVTYGTLNVAMVFLCAKVLGVWSFAHTSCVDGRGRRSEKEKGRKEEGPDDSIDSLL